MTLSLPPTDGAYGSGPFSDPLVFVVMSMFALISGVLVFPAWYVAVRKRPIGRSLAIVLPTVLLWIIVATPFHTGLAFLGSYAALFVALGVCRFALALPIPGHCARRQYDLCGTVAAGIERCPECGTRVDVASSAAPRSGEGQ